MLQPHLKSLVGRRLFARFLLAALLPISGLAWYGYQNVGRSLVDAAHHRLAVDAKAYGMSLIESLNRHADALQGVLEQDDPTEALAAAGFAGLGFEATREKNSEQVEGYRLRLPAGAAPELLSVLPKGQGVRVAKLAAAGFWNNDTAPERFCVFDAEREVLHCSPGLSGFDGSVVPAIDRGQNSVVSERRIEGVEYLLGFWHARYLPTLSSPGFIVMVATPKAEELQGLARYRMAYSAAVLLALALAAGLSSEQIRQQMEPLLRLQESTRRLSAGDLVARSNIAGKDEFGQLGQAFDQMAERLEQRFHMLGLLSELDRVILGSSERRAVIETLLRDIHRAVPCNGVGLVAFNEAGDGQLFAEVTSAEGSDTCSGTSVRASDLPQFSESEGWRALPADTLPAPWMEALSSRPVSLLLAFPAHLKSRLDSLLLLAFTDPPESLDEIVQSGRSLADRLSIAASNIARKQMLYDQAHYDALTHLPNRLLLRDRTEQAIVRADRTGTSVALLFIDLDGFKQVNDSLGHTQGDTLLAEYANRLRQRMRQGDTVARLGGDEFVALIPDLARETAYATVDRLARSLNQALAEPFQLGEQHVVSPASIGIALYPDNASSHEELLTMADAAMYQSKHRTAGEYCFFTSNISALTRDRFELTQDLRDAIQRQELLLYYQPKVDAHTGRLAGAEALLRWQSPKRGLVSPGVFVHLLDEMGLSSWLGEWVLDQACAQMHAWDRQGFVAFPVSINFSPLQFERTTVLERVQAALSQYQLAPARLELEILESMAANELPNVRQNLIRLRALGVRVALDDFGTGFSSLVHLTQVPADILKLDRVFTHSLCTEPRQREIVELIISMAKVMDLAVVAEGVEHADQRELLSRMGCDVLQGYLIGRPVAPDEFATRWLAAGPSEETSAC